MLAHDIKDGDNIKYDEGPGVDGGIIMLVLIALALKFVIL